MEEEVVDYLYKWALSDGFKKSKEDFVKLLQTNDEVLSYAFEFAQKDGFKKDKNALGALVGRTTTAAPVATAEPTTTEPTKTEVVAATTIPVKTEPANKEVVTEEPVKELSNKPLESVKAQGIPQKEAEMPTADTTKMPPMVVKEAEPEVKEEPKKEMPIGENLLPVTEKTEVKAVETPSDKMVIKSEKTQSVPSETIQGKGLFVSEDLKDIKLPKYKPEEIIDKKLLTENKESLGLKQFEDRDLIFKKWLESKGMPLNTKEESLNSEDRSEYNKYQYNQESNLTRAIVDSYLPYLMENKDKLSDEYKEKLRKELTSPTFKVFVQGFRGDFYNYDKNNPNFKLIEKVNEEYWRDPAIYSHVKSQYGIQDGEKQKMGANEFLQSPILKNSEKVITKFGPMFYDKENDTYYKYEYGILNAEPYVKYQLKNNPDYQAPLEIIKPGTEQHKLIKEGNKETWDGVDRTMYRGTSVKKDGNMQVKEVTEQPKMEVKEVTKEEPKGIPSYDDLGINPEKDPGSFLGATTDKNVKFEKMSPAELIGKDIFQNRGFDIKLERNKSLRYPDPPGTVFKKEKVGEREVYSSYDKANDKWYIYDENSNKDNWTEVKAGPIKTLLNSKYKENNKIIDSKIDYNSEEENNKISKIKEGILLNKYLPYVIKNWDNLSNEQKEDLKLDFADSSYYWLIRKNLERNDPNLEFWVDVNNKLIGNQAISSNIIDVYDDVERKIYKTMTFEIPQLNKDIKEGKYKFLKSVAGDVLYDEKNDIFYHGDSFKENELKREEGVVNIRTIPKGTPAYDKIKSSLSKYNK